MRQTRHPPGPPRSAGRDRWLVVLVVLAAGALSWSLLGPGHAPAGRPGDSADRVAPPVTGATGPGGPPAVPVGGPWAGLSAQTVVHLAVPIGFGLGVLSFLVVQSLVDHQDPKLAQAPARGADDSVGFS
ncbi:MAG: hypothetical protein ACRDY0_12420 [Acidimicrobiales bacterium]